MKWAAIAAGVVVGLIVLVAVVGSMLPRDHVAAMSARIAASPDLVWAALTDRAGFPAWRRDVKRVEMLPNAPSGPSWREHGSDPITYVAEVQEAPRRLVARIADQNLPYGGSWEYRIASDGAAGSTVTVIERGSVYNPVFRFISRFFMGHTSTIDSFLRALGRKFGTSRRQQSLRSKETPMGLEAKCRARVTDGSGTREADATVLLETDDLIVRGEARIKVPRASITNVTTRAGVLTVSAPPATITLTLGADAAAKWKTKIEEPPKRLIDKLDVKPGAKVWLFDVDDETLIAQLSDRTDKILRGSSASACDVVFVDVNSEKELSRISKAIHATHDSGAVWVIHRKGPTGVADTTIFGKAKALGLVYTKVARVSDRDTAEKLVRPRAP